MTTDQKQQPTALNQGAIRTNGFLKRLGLGGQIFRTTEGTAFIETDVGLRRETMQVKGDAFRKFLQSKLYHETGKVPSQAKLRSIIDLLETYALQNGPVAKVHVRVAKDRNYVYIDLADDLGRAVEISVDGWRVIDSPPVHFLRTPSMQPLPVPRWGGTIEELRAFFNLASDDDFVLAIAWLLGTYDSGPHPGLVISGEAGSGKSTLSEILQALIDPRSEPLRGLPKTEDELNASEAYLRLYDNVSVVPAGIADALCRHSTGRPSRPMIINSIDDVVLREDLSERCLYLKLFEMLDEKRRSQEEVWARFEKMRPRVLGILYSAVAHGLRSLPSTPLDDLPRMADFARWAQSCERAFWPEGTFILAYLKNRIGAISMRGYHKFHRLSETEQRAHLKSLSDDERQTLLRTLNDHENHTCTYTVDDEEDDYNNSDDESDE
jgi:energy-coupling factor transporter ATP-binding protein EcfA2